MMPYDLDLPCERCRHCGGAIEYVEADSVARWRPWWEHVPPAPTWPAHEAAPAFGGGS